MARTVDSFCLFKGLSNEIKFHLNTTTPRMVYGEGLKVKFYIHPITFN
jgi:hypothetical protein